MTTVSRINGTPQAQSAAHGAMSSSATFAIRPTRVSLKTKLQSDLPAQVDLLSLNCAFGYGS
jgi:hypothetical protein